LGARTITTDPAEVINGTPNGQCVPACIYVYIPPPFGKLALAKMACPGHGPTRDPFEGVGGGGGGESDLCASKETSDTPSLLEFYKAQKDSWGELRGERDDIWPLDPSAVKRLCPLVYFDCLGEEGRANLACLSREKMIWDPLPRIGIYLKKLVVFNRILYECKKQYVVCKSLEIWKWNAQNAHHPHQTANKNNFASIPYV